MASEGVTKGLLIQGDTRNLHSVMDNQKYQLKILKPGCILF